MPSVSDWSKRRLASILEAYLKGEKWVTEKRLEGEIKKSHSVDELKQVLEDPNFSYLSKINLERLEQVKKKFLSGGL